MGQVMVATYLAAHRGQIPDAAWDRPASEWTPAISADAWSRSVREIAAGERLGECIYVAVDEDQEICGVAMGGPASPEAPQAGAVYALYVSTRYHGRGNGRRLVQAVAAELARCGMTTLQIGCLAANAPARDFYEAIGGRVLGERLADEAGTLVPEVVYEWADIRALSEAHMG
jgi:ribosomal protein S18 acetylase RimI-like enzyme